MNDANIAMLAQGFWERKTLEEVAAETVSHKFNVMGFAHALINAATPFSALVGMQEQRIAELETQFAAALQREAVDYNEAIDEIEMLNAKMVPPGYKLVPIAATNEIVCAIEHEIDNQVDASGMSGVMHRQDGQQVWDAAIAAVSVNTSQQPENEISL